MFVYSKRETAQLRCDSYNGRDHTKDWCNRPQIDDGKRAYVVPHGKKSFTIAFKIPTE